MKKRLTSLLTAGIIAIQCDVCSVPLTAFATGDEETEIVMDATIQLDGDSASVEGDNVYVNGTVITVTASGCYEFSGTLDDGQINVNVADTIYDAGTVKLFFNGVSITGVSKPAVFVNNAKNTSINLIAETENYLYDGENAYLSESGLSFTNNAVIFAKDDITIKGDGYLRVEATQNHGVHCDNDLKITGGKLKVKTTGEKNDYGDQFADGIRGKESVQIKGGIIDINANGDGIKSTKGFVAISGGDIEVKAGKDAVQAEKNVTKKDETHKALEISGGRLKANGDRSLTVSNVGYPVTISGGKVFATATDEQPSNIELAQPAFSMFFTEEQVKDVELAFQKDNEIVFSEISDKKYSYVLASSPDFSSGTEYTIRLGETEINGLLTAADGIISAKVQISGETMTLETVSPVETTQTTEKTNSEKESTQTTTTESSPRPTSGKCGQNLRWNLSEDGTLTINGTGDMWNYGTLAGGDNPLSPWFYEENDIFWNMDTSHIKRLIIEEGVSSIGDFAFHRCDLVQEVTLPEGLNRIGVYAFGECDNLETVVAPSTLLQVDNDAFGGTPWLENQPDGVVYLGNCAVDYNGSIPPNGNVSFKEGTVSISGWFFNDHSEYNLISIYVPDSVVKIGGFVFGGTGWYDQQPDGLIYAGKVLIGYKGDFSSKTELKVKKGTISIADFAFSYMGYDEEDNPIPGPSTISLPDSLIAIGDHAFSYSGIQTIRIPEGVKIIGESAFVGAPLSSVIIPRSVEEIGADAFGCPELEVITIENPECTIGLNTWFTDDTAPVIWNSRADFFYWDWEFDKEIDDFDHDWQAYDEAFEEAREAAWNEMKKGEYAYEYTVDHEYDWNDNVIAEYSGVIRGYTDSTAQTYAEKCGFCFEAVDSSIETTASESTTTSTEVTTESGILKGDFSGNGKLSIADAVLCIRFLAEDNTISAKTKALLNPEAVDFDHDRTITMTDVSHLLTYLAEQGVQP